LKIKSNS